MLERRRSLTGIAPHQKDTISKIRRLSWVLPFLLGLSAVEAQEGFWDDERRLGPEINRYSANNATVSGDGLTMIFGSGKRPGGVGRSHLWIATRSSRFEEFGDVRNLSNVNTPGDEVAPSLSRDGLRLYFSGVDFPTQVDIFVASRLSEEETFGPPTPVQGRVNTGAIELYPVISSDELALYFARDNFARDNNLYVATRAETDQPFDDVRELQALNTGVSLQHASSISSDGLTLFFFRTDFRTFARGWMSTRESQDGPFGEPVPVPGSVNVGPFVGAHYVSADWPAPGSKLYFSRCEGGMCDIREATWHRDCNGNGIDDVEEITDGDAQDVNANDIPDECDLPLARFTLAPQAGEVPLEVEVDAGASEPGLPGHPIVSYTWDFGDGATAQGNTAKHTYTSPGHFEISLTITDDRGVTGTAAKRVMALLPSQLEPPWSASDVGETDIPGGARFKAGCLDILGPRGDIRFRSDTFHFVHQRVAGDFSLAARLSDWGANTTGAKLGLMVRESLEPDARHGSVALERRSNGSFRHIFLRREGSGATTRRGSHESYARLDIWLRLQREGTVISGSLSLDGMNWTAPDTVELDGLPEEVYVGVASSRGETDHAGAWPLASVCDLALTSQTEFLRGDCNGDGEVNISDATCALNWLFGGAAAPGCLAALNTNGDGDVNIADPVSLLNFLFAGGPAPVAPFPDCGPGTLPADAELGCANPPDCQ